MENGAITSFTGEYRWLSNFSDHSVTLDRRVFPTVEHYYQWCKTDDDDHSYAILTASTPGHTKRLGKTAPLRDDWDKVKRRIMLRGVMAKFDQHSELAEKLLATGNRYLIEGNTWGDVYWGQCNGEGSNYLGRTLMLVRGVISFTTGDDE